jgi:hypothetical protein
VQSFQILIYLYFLTTFLTGIAEAIRQVAQDVATCSQSMFKTLALNFSLSFGL